MTTYEWSTLNEPFPKDLYESADARDMLFIKYSNWAYEQEVRTWIQLPGADTFRLRSRMVHRSEEKLKKNSTDAKAAKQWEAGHIISLAMAEGVAFWGLVIRMVFHGTLWQASVFYAMAISLLFLWTPRLPSMAPSI